MTRYTCCTACLYWRARHDSTWHVKFSELWKMNNSFFHKIAARHLSSDIKYSEVAVNDFMATWGQQKHYRTCSCLEELLFFLLKIAAYEGGQNKPKTLNLWGVKVKTMS